MSREWPLPKILVIGVILTSCAADSRNQTGRSVYGDLQRFVYRGCDTMLVLRALLHRAVCPQ